MNTVKIDNESVHINGNEVDIGHTIAEYIDFDDIIVIRLEVTGDDFDDKHQNVIGINPQGKIQWKIQKAPEEGYYDSYSGIHKEDSELFANNLMGMKYRVDLESGDVEEYMQIK